jgi:hypothetical protein
MPELEVSREFIEAMSWIRAHQSTLRKTYQGQWIAVYQDRLVASGSSFNAVGRQAVQKTGQPANRLAVVFIDDPHCIYHMAG